MAETEADTGYGTELGIETSTAGTYAYLAEVTNISGLGETREVVDATHLKSPDRYREKIASLRDAKDVTITIHYVPGSDDEEALIAAMARNDRFNAQVRFLNGDILRFSSIITDFSIGDLTAEGKMEATATFTRSGKGLRNPT